MKINFRGDKMEVTKSIKEYATEKLGKLDKFFDDSKDINVSVLIRVKNKLQTIEVTIPTNKFTIRAEESNDDLYAAIDLVVDKLDRLIKKNKGKFANHYKDIPDFDMNLDYPDEDETSDESVQIVKRKNIDTKPMDEDEAILQMQLLNHDFFAFKNIDEECVSVLYLRKDGSYGIINIK